MVGPQLLSFLGYSASHGQDFLSRSQNPCISPNQQWLGIFLNDLIKSQPMLLMGMAPQGNWSSKGRLGT